MFFRLFLALSLLPLLSPGQAKRIHVFQTDNLGGLSQATDAGYGLFFTAWDSLHGRELWISDGTEAGTRMVKDIYPGLNSGLDASFEYNRLALNGILYFRANDGVHGFELWRSDGTASGTYLIKELGVGQADGFFGNLTPVNTDFYFTGGIGQTLWKSDGTTAGTIGIRSFSILGNLYGFNGVLYFSADAANNGQELWRSNGTLQGTFMLKDLNGVAGASLPCNFHATGNRLYFMAATNDGWELWRTNGTAQGTFMVKDINPGGSNGVLTSYNTAYLNHVADTLFFRADDGVNGFQLWKTDGSVAGTKRLSLLPGGVDPYCAFPLVNNKILFNNYNTPKFYQYDLANGNISVSNYPSASWFNSYYGKHVFSGSQMYFTGKDSVYGAEIFKCDGSATGANILQETHLVNNFTTSGIQGFNTIAGINAGRLIFTNARTAFNTEIPLFSYDIDVSASCYSPSVIIAVPRNSTEMHLVWNRTGATEYRVRYKAMNSASWTTKVVTTSYLSLKNLSLNTTYQYQVRAVCNGVFTQWSDTGYYTTGVNYPDYTLTILADRPESSTVQRIWWFQTQYITSIRVRYRVAGSLAWTVVGNSDGMLRITGLQPGTLYEYQYKPMVNGIWDIWYPASLYFKTDAGYLRNEVAEMHTAGLEDVDMNDITVSPNPTRGVVNITGDEINAAYFLVDITGNIVLQGKMLQNAISLEGLAPGIYFLQLESNKCRKRIIKL